MADVAAGDTSALRGVSSKPRASTQLALGGAAAAAAPTLLSGRDSVGGAKSEAVEVLRQDRGGVMRKERTGEAEREGGGAEGEEEGGGREYWHKRFWNAFKLREEVRAGRITPDATQAREVERVADFENRWMATFEPQVATAPKDCISLNPRDAPNARDWAHADSSGGGPS
jgi:hypothetical protein